MIFKKKTRSTEMRDHLANPLFSIGRHSYGEPKILSFDKHTRLNIGRYCSFSDNITILLGGNHRLDWVTTYPFPAFNDLWPEAETISGHPTSNGDINIGNDVWIGYGATILSGITIGDGAVIGAKAVVCRDVDAYEVAAGNPAAVVKKRFSAKQIALLLKLAWWNWPEEKIRANIHLLCSPDTQSLVDLL